MLSSRALAGGTRNASVLIASGVSASSDAMLSSTQMLRPCVPTMRSLSRGWIRMSSTGTFGMFRLSDDQVAPPSIEKWMPRSCPRKSRPAFRGCSRSRCTDVAGRPDVIARHVWP